MLTAPLPRAWQWLDASAFPSHGELMQKAFNLPPIATTPPLMYQGMSHRFLGPTDDVPLPSEAGGIDFEGEFGIITGLVPMGTASADAPGYICLAVQINDWSLRAYAAAENEDGLWLDSRQAGVQRCSGGGYLGRIGRLLGEFPDHRSVAGGRQRQNVWRRACDGNAVRFSRTHRACSTNTRAVRRHRHWFGYRVLATIPRNRLVLHRRAARDRNDRPWRAPNGVPALQGSRAHVNQAGSGNAFSIRSDGPTGCQLDMRVTSTMRVQISWHRQRRSPWASRNELACVF